MKKYFFVCFLCFANALFAQKIESDSIESEPNEIIECELFMILEEPAQPIGGYPEFYKYIRKNLVYPTETKRMGLESKVYIQFVVEKDGSLTNFKILKSRSTALENEVIRVFKEAPKWIPAKQRGKLVRQQFVMPISIKLG